MAHPSITVRGPKPPQDQRALKARLLITRMMAEAPPVPADYRPDETVTEDGSEAQFQAPPGIQFGKKSGSGGVFQQNPSSNKRRRFDDKGPEDFSKERNRTRRRDERKTGTQEEGHQPRAPPPPKTRGNYLPPEWACPPTTRYFLNVYRKKELDHRIELSKKTHYMIGRMSDCDMQLMDNSVSRYHAVLQHGENGLFIYDLGSTHGTFVNDHKELRNEGLLEKRKYKRLLATDIVMFGNYSFYYVVEGGDTRQNYELRKRGELPPQSKPRPIHSFTVPLAQDGNNEDNKRERDYTPETGRGDRERGAYFKEERLDIKAVKDHFFRQRFNEMR